MTPDERIETVHTALDLLMENDPAGLHSMLTGLSLEDVEAVRVAAQELAYASYAIRNEMIRAVRR